MIIRHVNLQMLRKEANEASIWDVGDWPFPQEEVIEARLKKPGRLTQSAKFESDSSLFTQSTHTNEQKAPLLLFRPCSPPCPPYWHVPPVAL